MKIIIALIIILFTQQFYAQNRYALVIGNANYKNAPLKNTINDAQAISQTLKSLNFKVVTLLDARIDSIEETINIFSDLIQKDPSSIRLFYYSGHGIQIEGGNYLVPIDKEFKNEIDVKYNSINVKSLIEKMTTKSNSGPSIIILDACRTNSTFKIFSRSGKEGLSPENPPSNSIIAFAAQANQTASDNTNGKNGLYTQELLRFLNSKNLELEKIFKYTGARVDTISNYLQQPEYNSSIRMDICLNGKCGLTPIISSAPVQLNVVDIANSKGSKPTVNTQNVEALNSIEGYATLRADFNSNELDTKTCFEFYGGNRSMQQINCINRGKTSGVYKYTISGLENGVYYYRAYATNEKGEVFGDWKSFTINKPVVLKDCEVKKLGDITFVNTTDFDITLYLSCKCDLVDYKSDIYKYNETGRILKSNLTIRPNSSETLYNIPAGFILDVNSKILDINSGWRQYRENNFQMKIEPCTTILKKIY